MRWVLLVAHLVACISDPWATLGVPRSASQKDIKKGQVTIFPIYESFLSKIASYVLVRKIKIYFLINMTDDLSLNESIMRHNFRNYDVTSLQPTKS